MTVKVNSEVKKSFIRELQGNFSLKRRESNWILNYIADNARLIENVHFVDDVTGYENAITMAVNTSDEKPFTALIEGTETTDAEKTFHHMRLNVDKPWYIKIDGDKQLLQLESYVKVVGDNPNVKLPNKYSVEAQKLIDKMEYEHQLNWFKTRVDEALDNGDKESFMKYSEELKSFCQ